jgi:acetylornithine deacetylase/succinyl-diaminopimelate desuccinylase-like protein
VSPPFAGAVVSLPGRGECIVGRGAEDAKGPFAATMSMIAAHRAAGVELPVNLVLLQEASELGSKSLPDFVARNLESLADVDVAYWPWHTQRPDGTAVAWLGVKGLMTMKLRVRGGEWGGPVGSEVHGLHSVWVASPAHRLIAALASLKSPDDQQIVVDGFFDPVPPPTAVEEQMISDLAARVDPAEVLGQAHAVRFKQGGFEAALRAYCFSTEINVSGIRAGLVIEGGHKVELPSTAVASLDLRPLDGMTVDHIVSSIRRHLDDRGFFEVEIEVLNGYAGGSMPADNWAVQALLATYAESAQQPEVWPRTSTAIASHLFIEKLGVPWIATCLGNAGNKHAPDEYVSRDGYLDASRFIARLMWRLAEA